MCSKSFICCFSLIIWVLSVFSTIKMEKFHNLVLGVYCEDPNWERIVTSTFYPLYEKDLWGKYLNAELYFIKNGFNFDMQGIGYANESLRLVEMSAVIGPYNPALSLVADDLKLPYLVTTLPDVLSHHHSPFTFMMHPPHKVFHAAAIDVMKSFRWTDVTVLYDSKQGLQLIGDIMGATDNNFKTQSWLLSPDLNDKDLKNHLLRMRINGQQRICVVCNPKLTARIFQMALKFSMLSYIYSWMVVTLNPYQVDFSNYSHTQVNFTTFEPMLSTAENSTILRNASFLDNVLAFQAIQTITHAASEFVRRQSNRHVPCRKGDGTGCSNLIKGMDISQYFYDKNSTENKEGVLTFNNVTNELSSVHLAPVVLEQEGLKTVGSWYSELREGTRLMIPPWNDTRRSTTNQFGKRVYKVVAIVDPPFVMYTRDYKNKEGKQKFEGFLLDLLEVIAGRLNFEYEVYEVPDQSYGSRNEDGTWNGMINELIQGEADMCIGAISITSEREEVIDFTKPFMQKSYNLLIKKPEEKTSIFQFLWPFTREVWLLTISSLIILGFLLFIMDRLSPNSSDPRFRFDLKESIWFIYGSLVGAGTEMVPRTISGRLLTGAWWFFALILISSYTANLAAFLTVTKIDTPIRSLSDLVKQTSIKYGTVRNTNAHTFFRTSKLELFQEMWRFIGFSEGLVQNSSHGLQRVQEGNYAFIWDTPVNKYLTMKHCDVMTVGEPFDQKGYGIGVPRGASYRDDLTMNILEVNEEGKIQELENKWWSTSDCEAFQDTSTARTKELNFFNVAGVFLVLGIGCVLALIASVIEFFAIKLLKSKKKKLKLKKECELQTSLYNEANSTPPIKRQKSWMFT